ncbi:hypothetical protein R5R35_008145 [Gryllus longicercus]|uniref:Uncharacterized protein n=1 Tax=Gryllus longicercus TaxID=2509291 RepID=A0AAN9Z4F6_9ORTH
MDSIELLSESVIDVGEVKVEASYEDECFRIDSHLDMQSSMQASVQNEIAKKEEPERLIMSFQVKEEPPEEMEENPKKWLEPELFLQVEEEPQEDAENREDIFAECEEDVPDLVEEERSCFPGESHQKFTVRT